MKLKVVLDNNWHPILKKCLTTSQINKIKQIIIQVAHSKLFLNFQINETFLTISFPINLQILDSKCFYTKLVLSELLIDDDKIVIYDYGIEHIRKNGNLILEPLNWQQGLYQEILFNDENNHSLNNFSNFKRIVLLGSKILNKSSFLSAQQLYCKNQAFTHILEGKLFNNYLTAQNITKILSFPNSSDSNSQYFALDYQLLSTLNKFLQNYQSINYCLNIHYHQITFSNFSATGEKIQLQLPITINHKIDNLFKNIQPLYISPSKLTKFNIPKNQTIWNFFAQHSINKLPLKIEKICQNDMITKQSVNQIQNTNKYLIQIQTNSLTLSIITSS